MRYCFFSILLSIVPITVWAQDVRSVYVEKDPREIGLNEELWQRAPGATISLMAQPMINPRPKETTTSSIAVRSVHDGEWIAFLLEWADSEKSEAGILGEFSDAVALQFPAKASEFPPPVFMGAKGAPVHIFHWRAQYQKDKESGKPRMKDIYPNLSIDIYPMEYPDWGAYEVAEDEAREQYSPGVAAANPQAYQKTGVDEIYAEGFSTSSVQEGHKSQAFAEFIAGKWRVIIARPLVAEGGSELTVEKNSFLAFAVWQGGKGEVGSRKSVTMSWTPLIIEEQGK